jgi:glycosyltransferase involved in cell wall biosynthesis
MITKEELDMGIKPFRCLIGVSTVNKLGFLQMCIPQNYAMLNKMADWITADWVIIDDGSSDGTWEWLGVHGSKFAKCIRMERSCGISPNKNFLFDMATKGSYDAVVCLDDDLLLSYRWLQRLAFSWYSHREELNIGVVSPFVINDRTMIKNIEESTFSMEGVMQVCGVGGACTLYPKEVYSQFLYDSSRPNYFHSDAVFHDQLKRAGYSLFVDTQVSAVHLPYILWLDPELEKAKLRIRHGLSSGEPGPFEESYLRNYNKVLNRFIRNL